MTAFVLAVLAAHGPREVTGPVNRVAFDALGRASGLTVGLNVGPDDLRWADRDLSLAHATLTIQGKPATLPEAIAWLATAVKVDDKREKVPGVIEVTARVWPHRYVRIDRADFRLVPWEQHFPTGP